MNIRELILLQCETDLKNFRVQYGYELDYPTIIKGYIPISEVKTFPTVCYDLGNQTSQNAGVVNSQQMKTCQLYIWVYIDDKKEKGKVINIREQAISDIEKFIMGDSSITDYDTRNWKVLRFSEINFQGQYGNGNITEIDPQIEQDTYYSEGKAEIQATVNISYYDFHSQTQSYQNI